MTRENHDETINNDKSHTKHTQTNYMNTRNAYKHTQTQEKQQHSLTRENYDETINSDEARTKHKQKTQPEHK